MIDSKTAVKIGTYTVPELNGKYSYFRFALFLLATIGLPMAFGLLYLFAVLRTSGVSPIFASAIVILGLVGVQIGVRRAVRFFLHRQDVVSDENSSALFTIAFPIVDAIEETGVYRPVISYEVDAVFLWLGKQTAKHPHRKHTTTSHFVDADGFLNPHTYSFVLDGRELTVSYIKTP